MCSRSRKSRMRLAGDEICRKPGLSRIVRVCPMKGASRFHFLALPTRAGPVDRPVASTRRAVNRRSLGDQARLPRQDDCRAKNVVQGGKLVDWEAEAALRRRSRLRWPREFFEEPNIH